MSTELTKNNMKQQRADNNDEEQEKKQVSQDIHGYHLIYWVQKVFNMQLLRVDLKKKLRVKNWHAFITNLFSAC